MHDTQVSVWEIQHPDILCQYQDTVELQETPLQGKMGSSFPQGTRTMMARVTTVHRLTKAVGGMLLAGVHTSMVSTMVDHIVDMMVWPGMHGGDPITPLNLLK